MRVLTLTSFDKPAKSGHGKVTYVGKKIYPVDDETGNQLINEGLAVEFKEPEPKQKTVEPKQKRQPKPLDEKKPDKKTKDKPKSTIEK